MINKLMNKQHILNFLDLNDNTLLNIVNYNFNDIDELIIYQKKFTAKDLHDKIIYFANILKILYSEDDVDEICPYTIGIDRIPAIIDLLFYLVDDADGGYCNDYDEYCSPIEEYLMTNIWKQYGLKKWLKVSGNNCKNNYININPKMYLVIIE
jgi:hypothetical protein